MSGGQSNLRTAAIALGLALVTLGTASLMRGAFGPANGSESRPVRNLAADLFDHRLATSTVALGPLEAIDEPSAVGDRTAPVLPTQLLTEIESDDLPPLPKPKPTDASSLPIPEARDGVPSTQTPAAELLDIETTSPPAAAKTGDGSDAQALQLARIANSIEWLSRQALLTMAEHRCPDPIQLTTASPVPERTGTAVIKIERTAEDRDRFSLEVRRAPVHDVLDVLCELAGLKLEMAGDVTGQVSLTLRETTLGDAINRVLQQSNLGVERDGSVLRVMPRTMAEERALHRQPLVTRQYRPRAVNMHALLPLIRPLLTPRIGRLTTLPDRDEKPCPPPATQLPAEVLVIVDRAEVHEAVARLLMELDPTKPLPEPSP